jgi:hypothetical protein
MILHVVLFRPRADVTEAERRGFAAALAKARATIPDVLHFWVGKRVTEGPAYLMSGFPDFPYAAVVAVRDRAALDVYLNDPAHDAMSRYFNGTAEAALIYDYELGEPEALGFER